MSCFGQEIIRPGRKLLKLTVHCVRNIFLHSNVNELSIFFVTVTHFRCLEIAFSLAHFQPPGGSPGYEGLVVSSRVLIRAVCIWFQLKKSVWLTVG